MEIIIAIDLIDGCCVRLEQGDYDKKTIYSSDPLEVAKMLEGNGIWRLHLVDLDGAKAGQIQNIKVLERIATNTNLNIDFGGGIKTKQDIQDVLNAGAMMVAIGSMAVKNKTEVINWAKAFGSEKIFIGADVKNEKLSVHGWLEESDLNIFKFIPEYINEGIYHFFCTDISKDGMLTGPSFELYKKLLEANKELKLTASGGVSRIEDVYKLHEIGCSSAIIGKAFYENRIGFKELNQFLIYNSRNAV